jgi:large subunit ribosomal protein L18
MSKLSRSEARIRRHRRVRLTVKGSLARPRLNVYRSLSEIYAQVIDDVAGQTLVSASTIDQELREKIKGLPIGGAASPAKRDYDGCV